MVSVEGELAGPSRAEVESKAVVSRTRLTFGRSQVLSNDERDANVDELHTGTLVWVKILKMKGSKPREATSTTPSLSLPPRPSRTARRAGRLGTMI